MQGVSISQVNAYLACPLKYRFRYIDKIPPPWRVAAIAFGSSIHAAVEWFHKERLGGRTPLVEKVTAIFAADWYAQNVEPLVFSEKESKDGLAVMGRQLLALYVAEANGCPPVAVEQRFELDLVDPTTGEAFDLRLHGMFDLIETDDTVSDLKTAGRTLEAGGLDRHLQLSTYALAYFLLHGRIPRLRLDMLLKTKVPKLERHETTRYLEDLGWIARLIRRVALAIHEQHFFPNPS